MKRVVLVGAGHAHLHALGNTRHFTQSGVEIVLVSPSRYLFYSGMATGVLAGHHSRREALINAAKLAAPGGGIFLEDTVESIRPEDKTLILGSGGTLDYDAVSFATGSYTDVSRFCSGDGLPPEAVIPVKPVENLLKLRDRLLRDAGSVLVAGGGAAGCEVAANVASLMMETGSGVTGADITLCEPSERLLPASPRRASEMMHGSLEDLGVAVKTGVGVRRIERGQNSTLEATLTDGETLSISTVVVATGTRSSELFASSGLPVGRDGSFVTDEYLRSVASRGIFGGGDAISFGGYPGLPGFGVHAIKQGPMLTKNLLATVNGGRLEKFRPQKRNLYVMSLGGREGLAVYGGMVWRGRSALLLKDYIDRRFVKKYAV